MRELRETLETDKLCKRKTGRKNQLGPPRRKDKSARFLIEPLNAHGQLFALATQF